MPDGLWEFLNAPSGGCHRRIGLGYFDDTYGPLEPDRPCCSTCNPDFQVSIEAYDELKPSVDKNGSKAKYLRFKLGEWRDQITSMLFPLSHFQCFSSLVMPDEILETISMFAPMIQNGADLSRWTEGAWSEQPQYEKAVLEIIDKSNKSDLASGEMFEVWKAMNDRNPRRRKLYQTQNPPPPKQQSPLEAFNDRRESWLISRGYSVKPKEKKRRRSASVESSGNSPRRKNKKPSEMTRPDESETISYSHSLEGRGEYQTDSPIVTESGAPVPLSSISQDTSGTANATEVLNDMLSRPASPAKKQKQKPQTNRRQALKDIDSNIPVSTSRELPKSQSGRERRRPASLMD